jgi:hypothetical protein
MAGLAVRESVTPAGRAERGWGSRTFAAGVPGPGHPCEEVAVLLVSELSGDSGSGAAGDGPPPGTPAALGSAVGGVAGTVSLGPENVSPGA